jgi:hypothetical protein
MAKHCDGLGSCGSMEASQTGPHGDASAGSDDVLCAREVSPADLVVET